MPDAGEVRRCDAGTTLGGPDGEPFPVERLDDFGGQDGLEPMGICIPEPYVAEYVPASVSGSFWSLPWGRVYRSSGES